MSGFVYWIQARKMRLIKIGISSDPKLRLHTMQTGSPDLLNLLGLLPNATRVDELAWHIALARFNVRGEWYDETPEVLASIGKHAPTECKEAAIREMAGPVKVVGYKHLCEVSDEAKRHIREASEFEELDLGFSSLDERIGSLREGSKRRR